MRRSLWVCICGKRRKKRKSSFFFLMLRKLLFQTQPLSIFAHAISLWGNKQQEMRAGEMGDDGIYHFEWENGQKEKRSTFRFSSFKQCASVWTFIFSCRSDLDIGDRYFYIIKISVKKNKTKLISQAAWSDWTSCQRQSPSWCCRKKKCLAFPNETDQMFSSVSFYLCAAASQNVGQQWQQRFQIYLL